MAVGQLPPLLMSGTRYLLAGILLYAACRPWRHRAVRPPSWGQVARAGVVGLFLLLGGNGLLSIAEVEVPSGVAALVIATVPLWMALLGLYRRNSPSPGLIGWLGVGVGLVGVAVLADPASHAHLSWLPAVALLAAAVLWAVGSLYARRADLPAHPLIGAALEMVVGGAAMVVLGLVLGEGSHLHLDHLRWGTAVAYAWLVVGGSILGYSCYVYALRHLPPSTVATYAYVNPAVALLLGWIFLGQGLTPAAGLAALLIMLGVVLMVSGAHWSRARRPTTE